MKKIALVLLLISTYSYSQTKKIFHKSHSGKAGTLFMDSKNNFGPGMAPVRYRTPESAIKLNYVLTGKHQYPMVMLDTAKKTMRFFDLKDSIIGCDRNYKEYLNHGAIVYDVLTNQFLVYQGYTREYNPKPKTVPSYKFLVITDSVNTWEKRANYIRKRSAFIRDGKNHRILMAYPILDHTLTSELVAPPTYQEVNPIILDENIKKKEKKRSRKEARKAKKELRKAKSNSTTESEENENVPVVSSPTPPNGSLLRWMVFVLLLFSLFIFVGVKRIVQEEISKVKQ